MTGLRVAFSFLTRIPVRARTLEDAELARGVTWFPIVGGVIGAICGLVYAGSRELWTPFVSATLAVVAGLLVTGAFHEDGLADTADAFGGGRSRDDVIRILKDPRVGTFGAAALVAVLSLRVSAIASLEVERALLALPALAAISRAASLAVLVGAGPAGEGLGTSYATAGLARRVAIGAFVALALGGATLRLDVISVAGATIVVALVMTLLTRAKLGGASGDVLGATQQLSEVAGLLVVLAL